MCHVASSEARQKLRCPKCGGPADAALWIVPISAYLCRCDACGGFDGGAWRLTRDAYNRAMGASNE